MSWNFIQIILEAAAGGSGLRRSGVIARLVGLLAGFLIVAGAPTVVNALQGLLRTSVLP